MPTLHIRKRKRETTQNDRFVVRIHGNVNNRQTQNACTLNQLIQKCPTRPWSKMKTEKYINDRARRPINTTCYSVLDAPGFNKDFYTKSIAWSTTTNNIAVNLENNFYLLNVTTMQHGLIWRPTFNVTCMDFSPVGLLIAGTANGTIRVWDNFMHDTGTVGQPSTKLNTVQWRNNNEFTTAGKDNMVCHYDIRVPNGRVSSGEEHTQQVCCVTWNNTKSMLASGGNDDTVHVWDIRNMTKSFRVLISHKAAVRAIAWSPYRSTLLATGAGSADRTIKIWSVNNSTSPVQSIDTGSQVCDMIWNKENNQILTAHGYNGEIMHVWQFPSMDRIGSLRGHVGRVLDVCAGPRGNICSLSCDETLRFWNVFHTDKSKKKDDLPKTTRRKYYTRMNLR